MLPWSPLDPDDIIDIQLNTGLDSNLMTQNNVMIGAVLK